MEFIELGAELLPVLYNARSVWHHPEATDTTRTGHWVIGRRILRVLGKYYSHAAAKVSVLAHKACHNSLQIEMPVDVTMKRPHSEPRSSLCNKRNNAPVQEPWPSIVGDKANGNKVVWFTGRHDVSTNRILVVVYAASCTSDDIKRVL